MASTTVAFLLHKVVENVCIFAVIARKLSVLSRLRREGCQIGTGCGITVLNGLLALLVDTALGIGVIVYVTNSKVDIIGKGADLLNVNGDVVASKLQSLLSWVMGTPAGLKLNAPLNELLGRIFAYYVTVWQQYCKLLEPQLRAALTGILYVGIFGWSLQLACLVDLFRLLTIHIVCIYVHAARLYALFRAALACTFRLFRGRKWNPLRRRVDQARFDIDSLFVGTLVFTYAFFLMPTALVYYVIFATLRCAIKLVVASASRCITAMLDFPFFIVLAWFAHAECVLLDRHAQLVSVTHDDWSHAKCVAVERRCDTVCRYRMRDATECNTERNRVYARRERNRVYARRQRNRKRKRTWTNSRSAATSLNFC